VVLDEEGEELLSRRWEEAVATTGQISWSGVQAGDSPAQGDSQGSEGDERYQS